MLAYGLNYSNSDSLYASNMMKEMEMASKFRTSTLTEMNFYDSVSVTSCVSLPVQTPFTSNNCSSERL